MRAAIKRMGAWRIFICASRVNNVDDMLELRDAQKNGYTLADVQRVVANCSKQRFTLRNDPHPQIRANQGHSINVLI